MGNYIEQLNAAIVEGKLSRQEALKLAKAAREEFTSHMHAGARNPI